jgi:hypothetical protein
MNPLSVDPFIREQFYSRVAQLPETEAAWIERQAMFRRWRSDVRFEAFWPVIDHMLTDDFASCRRRAAAADKAMAAVAQLQGYDFDAWHEQREYDLKHARGNPP